ncbi:hypothetical protein LCI18_010752 [Fusarium solani-melongenae]|uniref:Uncharacterized protein n=1 Tax=Fusarium solani subsp. cucurbitae TaxID=2747967 RepID=A0ACD3ZFF5_FUSSC|nr:hypothetical protein LCI18_010752 [Fusarium solani-melongenae]
MSAYTSTLDDTSFRLATVELASGVENNRNEPRIPSITLTTYQISDVTTPSYNALSYTWGPPRRNAPGKPVWIDALCINQSNTAERQPQVSAMDRIYNGASTVLIWLGKPSAKLQLGLEIADRVSKLAMREAKRIISNQRYDLSSSLGDMKRNYGLEPFTLDEADGLVTLFESYWFSRVWIIQEVALAKEVGVFYGDGILSYDKIGATATFLHLTGLSIAVTTLVSIARGNNSADPLDEVHIYQAERIQLLREWCRGRRSNYIEDDQLINCPGKGGSAGLIILKLLLWTVGFRATDQRDVVYGLWGILQHMATAQGVEIPKHLRPNYDITAAELLQTVARGILETSGTLMLLTLVEDPSRRKTQSHPLCGPKFKYVAKVNAGGCMREMLDRLSLGEGDATLHLKGVSLGTVELIGESSDEIKDAKLEGWIRILSRMGQVYPPTGQSSFEAFWRHSFMAMTFLLRYPHHIYGTSFLQSSCRWVGLLPETETEYLLPPRESAAWRQSRHASAAVFELLLGGTLFFRRIALTSERYLAHASESMSTGDEVWIVSGCPSPLVLRRVGSGRDRYCLIGEGYVHRAMNGEAVANDVRWQDITLV